VKNIDDVSDVEWIFSGLFSYKKEDGFLTKVGKAIYNFSSLEKVIFNDSNPIINSFINHDGKFYKLDDINDNLDNKSNEGNKFFNLFSPKNNNVGFYGYNISIMKMEEEIKDNQEGNGEVNTPLPKFNMNEIEIKNIQSEIKLIESELSSNI
ncbi:hypothetical protein NOM03_18415, partial [Proteus terrae]